MIIVLSFRFLVVRFLCVKKNKYIFKGDLVIGRGSLPGRGFFSGE